MSLDPIDSWKSSESFQRVGMDVKDAIVNKGRVERERKIAEKKAAKKLARMRKREDKKRHHAAMKTQPPTLWRKIKRTIVTLFLLAAGILIWIYALGVFVGSA